MIQKSSKRSNKKVIKKKVNTKNKKLIVSLKVVSVISAELKK